MSSRLTPLRNRVTAVAAAISITLFAVPAARASDYVWTGYSGSNVWNTSSTNWQTGSGLTAWNNVAGDRAIFTSTGAGLLTIDSGGISAGSLLFNSNGYTIAGPGILTLTNGGSIGFNNGSSATLSCVVDGTTGLNLIGNGTLTLSGINLYTGGTTLTGGMLSISADRNLGAVLAAAVENLFLNEGTLRATQSFALDPNRTISLGTHSGGGAIDVVTGMNFTLSGIVQNGANVTGSVVKNGAGTLILGNGLNSWSGVTTISGGTLRSGVAGSIPSGAAVTVGSGATFDLNGFDSSLSSLNGAGTVSLGTGTLSVGSGNYSGTLGGIGGIVKTSNGSLSLTGANTYQGTTTIYAGSLTVTDDSGLGAVPLAPTPSSMTMDGGTLAITSGTVLNANRGIALGGAGGSLQLSGQTATYAGLLTGTGSFTVLGTGTLVLGGGHSINGPLYLSGSATLRLSATNALPAGISVQSFAGTPTLDLNGFDQTLGTLNSSLNVQLGGATLTFGNADSSALLSGAIGGTGTLIKVGLGLHQLIGTNTFTGPVRVFGGTLGINGDANLGTAPASPSPNSLLLDGGKLQFGGTLNPNRGMTFGSGGAGLNVVSGTGTYNGAIAGGGALTVNSTGSGTLVLGGSVATANITVSGGTLKLGASNILAPGVSLNLLGGGLDLGGFNQTVAALNGSGNVVLGSGTLTYSGSTTSQFLGAITSTTGGSLVKAGSGILQLVSGSSTYNGSTTINGGTLLIASDTALGTAPASATANKIILDGGTLELTLTTLNANRGVTVGTSGGGVKVSSSGVTYAGNTADPSAGSPGSFTVNGTSGALTLTGTSTFTGAVGIGLGASLRIQTGNGTLAAASSFTLQPGATLALGITGGGASGINTNRLGDTASLALNAANFTWAIAGTSTASNEALGTLMLGIGANAVTVDPNLINGGSSPGHGVVFASITRATGASIAFSINNSSNGTLRVAGSVPAGSGSILGGYAVVGSDWATLNGVSAVIPLATYQTSTNPVSWAAGDNVKVAAALTGSIPANATVHSLNVTTTSTITLAGNLTITGGGILSTSTGSITGGTIRTGFPSGAASELILTPTANTYTIASAIADAATPTSLTKAGSGSIKLTNVANSYSGGTFINSSGLIVTDDGCLGLAGTFVTITTNAAAPSLIFGATATLSTGGVPRPILLNNGGTLDSGTFTGTVPGTITGTGNLGKSGTGILILSGSNSYTGRTNVNIGTLRLGAANSLPIGTDLNVSSGTFDLNGFDQTVGSLSGSGAVILTAGNTLTLGPNLNFSPFNGTLTGSGTIVVQSPAGLRLAIANPAYTGKIKVTNGSSVAPSDDAQLGAVPASPFADAITLDSGSITYGTGTTYTLNVNRGITLGPGGGSFGAGGYALPLPTVTYNGVIAGSGKLSVTGGGTLILGGANTYAGGTAIQSSTTLNIGADAMLGTAPATPSNNLWLELSSTLMASSTFAIDPNRTIVLRGGSLGAASGQTLQFNGKLTSEAGITGYLSVTGTGGVVSISGTANDYIGGTKCNTGTLRLGATNALPTNTDVSVALGGTFDLNGFNQTVRSLNSVAFGSGVAAVALGTGTLTIRADFASSAFSGVIGGAGKIVTQGVSLTLTGANTLTGGLTVNAGTLQVNNDGNLGPAGGANVLTLNGSTLTFNNTSHVDVDANRSIVLGPGGGTIHLLVATQSVTIPAVFSGPGGLAIAEQGLSGHQFNLSGKNTYKGPTLIGGNVNFLGDHVLPDGTDLTLTDSSTTALHVNMGGTTQVIGSLSSTGSLPVNPILELGPSSTQLILGNSNSTTYFGRITGNGSITKRGTGTFTITNDNTNLSVRWFFNGGTVAIGIDTNLGNPLNGNTPVTDNLVFNGGTLQATTTMSLRRFYGITLNSPGGTLSATAGKTLTYPGIIAGVGGLTVNGPGIVALSGLNTFTGSTVVASGTLLMSAANSLPAVSPLVLADGTAPTVNLGANDQTVGSLAGGQGGGQVILTGSTLTVGGAGHTFFAGKLTGTGGVTRQGAGSLTVTGTNDYTGVTRVNGGSLFVNGSLSNSSPVTVNGGLLSGTGTAGAVAVNSGGSISAGGPVAPGSFTLTSLNLSGGAYLWKVGALPGSGIAGIDWDRIQVNGPLTLGSGAKLTVASFTGIPGWDPNTTYQWPIAGFTGGLIGSPAAVTIDSSSFPLATAPGATFALSSNSNALFLNYTPVPEPLTILAAGAGMLSLGRMIRRRQISPLNTRIA